jgi:FkbM family methyltransferase
MTDPTDLRLIHHHVGGRAGDTGFNIPQAFERDVVRVLYDADESAMADAEKRSAASGRTTIVRPYFVGSPGKSVTFHINFCPYTSSARTVSRRYDSYHAEVDGTDYVFGEVCAPHHTVELKTVGLDDITLGEGADLPAPDLLSIDTEGGEDDVIAGAQRLLAERVVAVTAEVKFNAVYDEGPLFGDISSMLREHGFLFIDFEHIGRLAPIRGRLGTRGRGLIVYGDAVYFKEPETILRDFGDRAGIALRQLAFTAITRGHFEFAQHCLAFCPPGSLPQGDIPVYLRFVDQFQRVCHAIPDIKPWKFTDFYTADASQARFTRVPAEDLDRIRHDLRARANAEADRIERLRDSLVRSVAESPLAHLFLRYDMNDAVNLLIAKQKETVTSYVGNVGGWSGRQITL